MKKLLPHYCIGSLEKILGPTSCLVRSLRTDKVLSRHISDIFMFHSGMSFVNTGDWQTNYRKYWNERQGIDLESKDNELPSLVVKEAETEEQLRQEADDSEKIHQEEEVETSSHKEAGIQDGGSHEENNNNDKIEDGQAKRQSRRTRGQKPEYDPMKK